MLVGGGEGGKLLWGVFARGQSDWVDCYMLYGRAHLHRY